MEFVFPPKSTRDGSKVRKRILVDTQKAIEKYKLAEEQSKQAEKVSTNESAVFDRPVFETNALYYANVKAEDDTEGDDSDSYFSHHSSYFHNSFLNRCCKRIVTSNRGLRLSWTQVMCFTFLLQVPITSIVHHVSIVQRWGGMMVLITYTVIGFIICVPVHMMYMFMGFFTNRSYIRYWECVPILKGVAFSLGGISMYQELFNVLFAAIAIQYIILMFNRKLPWYDCDFPQASKLCVPMTGNHDEAYNQSCCGLKRTDRNCSYADRIKDSFQYSAFEYYNRHILYLDENGEPITTNTHLTLTMILAIVWFLIFILLVLGLKRIGKVMTIVNLTMIVMLVPIAIIAFAISPGYSMIYEFSTNFGDSVTDYKFWLYTSLNIIHRELPADVIGYGAISKIGISVTVDTAIVYILKFFYTAVFTVWTSIGVKYQLTYYNILYSECVMADGDVLFFALFPDIISHMPAPQIWLIIYYLVIVIWGISTAVLVYLAFVEAIIEEFWALEKWRPAVCMVLCAVAAFVSIYNISPDMMHRMKSEALEIISQAKLSMLCVSFIGVYFYSITTFRHDYHFYTGEILGNYWIIGLKVSMLLVFISTTLNWFNILHENLSNYPFMLVLIPVVLGIVIVSIRYSLKITKTLISPTPKWGPPGRNRKLARIKFDPSHDLRYRSVVQKCAHSCLLYSNNLKKEVKYWLGRKNIAEGRDAADDAFALTPSQKMKPKI